MKKTFHIIFILLTTLISCEKIIEFDVETTKPKVVINASFETDKTWNLHLSSSLGIIDTSNFSNIENATVIIFNDQNLIIETLQHDSLGFYKGNTIAQVGQKYSIEVSGINFNNAYATDSIPIETSIIEIDTNSYIENNNDRLNILVRFNDSLLTDNYYKIAVRIGREKYEIITDTNGVTYIDSNYKEKWVNLKPESNFLEKTLTPKELIFNDNTFNGQESAALFSIKNLIKKNKDDDKYHLEFMTIYLYGISYGHYNYHKSMKIFEENSSNIFAQPVQVYSNVANGHGVFIGAHPNEFKLY